ncbi:testis-expressed protein 9 [Orussus abietinus]|uniref:testis-expressed protein 9 n=1 Tax=Orussus abietinus TaxID=222816 RepID=UPI0006258DD0|nr:testis-expressed protein 9 [Orussus abietinus]
MGPSVSDDLLAKEKEYHRQNREIEQKAQELMREVDMVINSGTNDNSLRTPKSNYTNSDPPLKDVARKRSDSVQITKVKPSDSFSHNLLIRRNSIQSIVEPAPRPPTRLKVDGDLRIDEIPPGCGDSLGTEAIIEFLKAKIRMLHTELQSIQLEYKKKCSYCKELESDSKKLDEVKGKLQNQVASLKDTILKSESTNTSLQSKIQIQATENSALRKDIEGLRKEVKLLNQQSSSYDVRLNRSLEDNEKLRNSLKFCQHEEKELREQIRKLQDDKVAAVKNLEKQRSELLQAFKKQALLIDNLKKQKTYLEASRQIQLTEEEFSKLLEWKPENV